jgi:hypothetical protein
MGSLLNRVGSRGHAKFALALLVLCLPASAEAQFFNLNPVRPPADIPGVTPGAAQNLAPPSEVLAPAAKAPQLQAQPPAVTGALPPHTQSAPAATGSGQAVLAVAARFGRDLPAINGGLHWRVYPSKPESSGAFRLIKEEKTPNPVFTLPPGNYVVHVAFGLASTTKAVQVRAGEPARELFEIPAGGLRIEGKVGDVRIPPGQISFDLYRGSQFEPGDRRPIIQSVQTGDVVLVPEGTYHIVSNYGDANATVRSDIRVQTAKLTDATVTHRAAVITLKLVNQAGGEARANTQWSVLTPGGDVVKESIGAFPRVILAEGDYRAIARNDDKTYERAFKVITGVDGEVEVLAH